MVFGGKQFHCWMSCDHELANEWARCSGKNASYITISVIEAKLKQSVSPGHYLFGVLVSSFVFNFVRFFYVYTSAYSLILSRTSV